MRRRLSEPDVAAGVATHWLDARKIPYRPHFRGPGLAELDALVRTGGPALVASYHAPLSVLSLRAFEDAGLAFTPVAEQQELRIAGRVPARSFIERSPHVLMRVVKAWQNREVVCSMVDIADDVPERTRHVEVDGTRVAFSTTLLDLAARWQVPVYFVRAAGWDGHSFELHLQPSAAYGSTDGDGLIESYAAFLRAHAGRGPA